MPLPVVRLIHGPSLISKLHWQRVKHWLSIDVLNAGSLNNKIDELIKFTSLTHIVKSLNEAWLEY